MPPVRVKVDGVFSMTRRTFLIVQAITLLVVLAAVAVGLWWPRPQSAAVRLTPRQRAFLFLLDLLPWAALLILVFEGFKTWLVLRQFARKQAEADRAQLPPAS